MNSPLSGSLGPYRLLRRLGAGGMAEVFLAVAFGASGFEKKVALKTLLPELRDSARFQRLLIEEARLAARLQHGNLVQVHELDLAEGVYFVRMDYVDGADLGALIRRERPPRALTLRILAEVVRALDFLHAALDGEGRPLGLVHRDVSPSNILLSRAGEVKLADFGVAKATSLADVTQAGVLKGKYAYMSPEQVAGEALTAASDQFGLGVTLLELLTGRRPYDGQTPLEVMDRVREAQPPDVGELDPELGALVCRCLARSPGDRFESDEALHGAIETVRRDQPASSWDLARWVNARLSDPPR